MKFLKIYDKKSIYSVLFGLGLLGLILVVKTADLGGQLVYRYGVGVQAYSQVIKEKKEQLDGAGTSGCIIDEIGSWQLLPSKKTNSAFSAEVVFFEGSSDDVTAQFKTLETNEQVIELN